MNKLSKILLTGVLCFNLTSSAFAVEMLQIKGSDTLINLVQRFSEVYMEKNKGKYIAVTGGGSGTGIAALINKKCDIANASRKIKDKEVKKATKKEIDIKRVVVALDGLCVIINPNNPVDGLTVEQIGKIFKGEITNWNQVGGPNLKIAMYGRQSNSGTFSFFRKAVLKGEYSQKMKRMNGNAQIVESVKTDKSAIGYVGVGYVKKSKGLKTLKVAAKQDEYYASPLIDKDVKSGKYPIVRALNQYISGLPKGLAKDFIKFELSSEGQKIVIEDGFFPVPANYKKQNKDQIGI